ncbi:MAG TPA: cytochrome c biogenesis protein ResB [Anaeromyxobacteraceae bacterium]|nr:cytochrome c biogenesis protein ResB [Anaeromyxobacteraceae bacterium]
MSTNASPAAASAVAAVTAPPTSTRREVRRIGLLVGGAPAVGALIQAFVGPGSRAAAATAAAGGAVVFAACHLAPRRWRDTLTGFRFTAVLLFALAAAAVLGTVFVQGKPAEYYPARYDALGTLILALRLDDIFHSLWFAALLGLLVAAVASSAVLRFPPRAANLGFLLCHAGLLATLAGAAVSSAFAVKGRIDLHAGGESTSKVRVTRNGALTGEQAELGFDMRLDRFDLASHDPEFRIAYYEPSRSGEQYSLRASFDLEVGVRHLLPHGDAFRIARLDPDAGGAAAELRNPAAVLEIRTGREVRETPLLFALRPGSNYARLPNGVLVFEKRAADVKSFVSHVTLTSGDDVRQARVAVNEPLSFGGWTLYQADFDPRDPTYSGMEAVRDPGVDGVFVGFLLISIGVAWMFYGGRRTGRLAASIARARRGDGQP